MKTKTIGIALAAICAAMVPSPSWAETHTLQPYAYVQSHGVNRVDTGYCAQTHGDFR